MAGIFDGLFNIAIIVLIVVLVVGAIGGVATFFYIKQRNNSRKKAKEIDYSGFRREDTKAYIQIDDIKENVIITEGGSRFVGVLDCQGFDFYSAHIMEQSNTYENYKGFINTIDKPLSYRQFCKSVDLEETIEMYKEAYEKVCNNLGSAVNKLNEMQTAYSNATNMPETRKALYEKEISLTSDEIKALNFRKFHLEDQIRYIDEHSGVSTAPLVTSTYVFDWIYNPMAFSVDLSEEEVFARAKMELESIANSKIHALSTAGVKARRCNTSDLIDMCRRHSQPITGERYKMRDIDRSTYFEDITTTDFKDRMYSAVRETMDREVEELAMKVFSSPEDSLPNAQSQTVFVSAGNVEGVDQND